MGRLPLIAGNWKMHKTTAEAAELARDLRREFDGLQGAEIVLCPPFTALGAVGRELAGSTLALGAQNVHWERAGAFTGEVSAPRSPRATITASAAATMGARASAATACRPCLILMTPWNR